MSDRTCAICGEPLPPRSQKYCSRPCAVKANTIARKNNPERWARHRENCKRWAQENPERQREYSLKANYERRKCVVCGVEYRAHKYQSPDACPDPICRATVKQGSPPSCSIEHNRAWCEICGAPFRRKGKSRFCSKECRVWSTRIRMARAVNWRLCPDCGTRWIDRVGGDSRCPTCREARPPADRGSSWISPRRRYRLYERDNWTCQLCGEAINPDLDPQDDWAASLDHIIPRASGGGHGDDNLRMAHRWCNSVLGDGTRYSEEVFA